MLGTMGYVSGKRYTAQRVHCSWPSRGQASGNRRRSLRREQSQHTHQAGMALSSSIVGEGVRLGSRSGPLASFSVGSGHQALGSGGALSSAAFATASSSSF